jgi:hypothetical protein
MAMSLALTLAGVAVRMQDGAARQALEAGAERLFQAGLG